MMAARTQTGRGLKIGASERTTAIRVRHETRAVIKDLHPLFSWTRDLDNDADIGTQLKNDPTMLLTPWAIHSGLGGTL